ncbi:MAG: hypothetical protein ABL961_14785 [Vicinamibacterales bacterium]
MKSGIAFCLAEDRADCGTGLRLAILSLARHCPGAPVYVYRPEDPEFAQWVARFPAVTHISDRPTGATSWNCKPQALRPLLEAGYDEAVWLDSDLVITRDCRALFSQLAVETLAVAQEPSSQRYQGTQFRTTGWGLPSGRELPATINSSVVRVTRHHAQLLDRWLALLSDPAYLAAQQLPLEQRPLHLMGDQDLLNALVGSAEFASLPIRLIATGREIIHCGGALGYSIAERAGGLFSKKPTFLHATAGKPWLWLGDHPYWAGHGFFGWHRQLLQELSPYVFEARTYAADLGEPRGWLEKHTTAGMILRAVGFGHFALRGLPLTLVGAGLTLFGRKSI